MPREVVFLFVTVLTITGITVLLFPVVRALAERIRPRSGDASLRDDLMEMREELLAEIQQTRREISDLGERVDFTERLLAKKTESR